MPQALLPRAINPTSSPPPPVMGGRDKAHQGSHGEG